MKVGPGIHRPGARAMAPALAAVTAALAVGPGCSGRVESSRAPIPGLVSGAEWRSEAPTGYAADGVRRNLVTGESLRLSVAALMAWAVSRFDVPLDRIGGHYDHAATTCPGIHLRKYLENGTLRRDVEARLRLQTRS
jgi:hypothetical protein